MLFFNYLLQKALIASFLTTMLYHTGGCANQYCCALDICILSYLALVFSIIIDRSVGAPVHVKYMVYGMKSRDK